MIESKNGLEWRRARQFKLTRRSVAFEDGIAWTPDRMERPFVLAAEPGQPRILYVACKIGGHPANIAIPLEKQP
jgi:hypothetical protein